MEWFQSVYGAGLLVFLAGLFLVTEFLVKARGLAGVAGLCLLGFYVVTQQANLNAWIIGLLIGGLILVVVDGKLIGDGTLATIGILLMLAALVMPAGNWATGSVVGLMWLSGIMGGFLSLKFLPRRDMWNRIMLKEALTRETGYSSINQKYRELVGKAAVAMTDMRPTGTVKIEGELYSAVSKGIWVKKGTPLKVVSVDGTRILVDPAPGTENP